MSLLKSPVDDVSGSDCNSDNEDDREVSVNKRFADIIKDLKDGKFDPRDGAELEQFAAHNASYLGQKTTGDSDHKTLLHLLVDDAKDKVIENYIPLVRLLIDRHPNLLGEKDSNEKSPFYIAISKKREKLVRFMCETHPNIDDILKIPCYSSKNCLHVAIGRNVTPKLTIFLIEHAGEGTLCAKDDKYSTPLHLAVDYERCTDAQLGIVKALIIRCDKAMDERTSAPNFFSPYRFHEHTRAEAIKAAKEKEKEAAQRKQDKGNAVNEDGTGSKDGGNMRSKLATLIKDSKTPQPVPGSKEQGGSFLSTGTDNIGRLHRVNTSNEESPRKYGIASESYKESRAVNGAGYNSTELGSVSTGRRKEKEKEEVTEESAAAIRNYLKLHYMRTRNHDDIVEFLYGRNQVKSASRKASAISNLRTSCYMSLYLICDSKRDLPPLNSSKKTDGNGRDDMVFLFNFLRSKGVKRVIRVIVDDTLSPAHSDEAIEKALGGLKVEIWDWRKIDLSVDAIATAAPDTRKVCLYWSGNNAVLRGWSEPGGVNLLTRLESLELHIEQGLETAKRTYNNVQEFHKRLKLLRPDIKIEEIKEHRPEKHNITSGPAETTHEQFEHRHKWLTCMDGFAEFIQNVEVPLQPYNPVTIALIDDGVDINEQSLHAKIIGGRSFCQRDGTQNLSQPYYVTSGGHGTVMATLICRVCPRAQLYIIKLDEHMSEQSTRQITAKSAAKAVLAAVDKNVHIISMSWTIEHTPSNGADIRDLELAIETAAKAGILMFCAANDQGIARDHSFPAACGGTKHLFKIGAAEASGAAWKWVGDLSDVDFIFPGKNVVKERYNDATLERCRTLTGSSVATALAAGFAALLLYCVQLAALNTQALNLPQTQGGNVVTMEDFKAIQGHERMKEAFLTIGTSPASGNKYIEVWKIFEQAAKKGDRVGQEERIGIVVWVAGMLKKKTVE